MLTQTEAVLNNRPLTHQFLHQMMPSYLFSHVFLIGQPITELPDQDYSSIKVFRRCKRSPMIFGDAGQVNF